MGVAGAGTCRLYANTGRPLSSCKRCGLSQTTNGCVGEEDRGLQARAGENHSIAHASHVPVRRCPEVKRLVSVEAEDDGESEREAHVMQKLAEKHRSKFKNFDPRT